LDIPRDVTSKPAPVISAHAGRSLRGARLNVHFGSPYEAALILLSGAACPARTRMFHLMKQTDLLHSPPDACINERLLVFASLSLDEFHHSQISRVFPLFTTALNFQLC
jgi:hypothetical protein